MPYWKLDATLMIYSRIVRFVAGCTIFGKQTLLHKSGRSKINPLLSSLTILMFLGFGSRGPVMHLSFAKCALSVCCNYRPLAAPKVSVRRLVEKIEPMRHC